MATHTPDPLARLADALASEDNDLDPAYLGLLMAAPFYPDLNLDTYLSRVDDLAARAAARLGETRTPARVISALNGVLFLEEGFAGNVEDYYDPRNSFLNEVMDRKSGIPITLSVLYLAVARRLGQPIVGVGLPLHFIVKYVGEDNEIFVDPFHRGRVLTVGECQAQVERSYGAPVHFQESYLAAVPARLILYRMLNNLKFNFLRRQDHPNAGQVIEMMLVVDPDRTEEIRDRGLLLIQERRWADAAGWLTRYLEACPEAPDADLIRRRIQDTADIRARRN